MRLEIVCLCIVFHNPETIETVLPKLAARGVGGMGFAAIFAKCQMGTGLSISGRRNRGNLLRVALAAGSKSSMVFFAVWAHANRANHANRVAVVCVVAHEWQWVLLGQPLNYLLKA